MSFKIGDTVGGYKIVGVVGAGGVGQVFRVEHTITGRVEAMKVLAGRAAGGQEEAQRFLREVKVQAKLSHPNIAAVHNAFWLDDDLVMIMELVAGDSLQRSLERGPIPLAVSLDYACQALSALSYSHANGVIHRDIKPANLIVTPRGTVKLTDFGLAKTFADPQLTESGAVIGSLYYVSPEQVKGLPTLDARTDLYSLGVVLYETVTGKRPFDADQAYSLMVAHVTQEPRPPAEINSRLPPTLNEIILTALCKEPGERFQTADDFREALESVRQELAGSAAVTPTAKERDRNVAEPESGNSQPPQAQPSKPAQPPEAVQTASAATAGSTPRLAAYAYWKTLPRPVRRLGAVAAGAAVLVAIAFFIRHSLRPSDAAPNLRAKTEIEQTNPSAPNPLASVAGKVPAEELSRRPETGSRAKEEPLEAVESPPSRFSPEPQNEPLRDETDTTSAGNERHSEEAVAKSSNFRQIRSLRAGRDVWAVAFSPDGTRLAAGMGQNHLKVFDTATGKELASLTGHRDRVVSVSFSPDARRLASGSWDGTAKLWELHTGTEHASFKHKSLVTSVGFSPDGNYLASGSNDNTLKVWDVDASSLFLELQGHKRGAQALAFSPNGQLLASVSAEKTVRLWALPADNDKHELAGPDFGATAVAFSVNGRLLAVAGGNRLKVWDVSTRRELRTIDIPGWLHALTPTRSGSFLALSATPEAVKLWDVAKAEELGTIVRNQTVRSIALSPGGRRVATAADEGKIGVWEAAR